MGLGQHAQPEDIDMNAIWQLHRLAFATVLAGGAGIRATVPLFIMSLGHLVDSVDMPLSDSIKWLGHWYICAGLAALLLVEVLADMIPAVDNALHTCLTPIYPVVGAVVAAAPLYGGGPVTHVPMAIFGALLALASHGGKSLARAGTTSSTGGLGNSVQSVCGTLTLIVVCIIAVVVAFMAIIFAVVVVAGCIYATYTAVKHRQAAHKPPAMRRAAMPVLAAVRWRRASEKHHNQTKQTVVAPLTPQALRSQNVSGVPLAPQALRAQCIADVSLPPPSEPPV